MYQRLPEVWGRKNMCITYSHKSNLTASNAGWQLGDHIKRSLRFVKGNTTSELFFLIKTSVIPNHIKKNSELLIVSQTMASKGLLGHDQTHILQVRDVVWRQAQGLKYSCGYPRCKKQKHIINVHSYVCHPGPEP